VNRTSFAALLCVALTSPAWAQPAPPTPPPTPPVTNPDDDNGNGNGIANGGLPITAGRPGP